LQSRFTVKRFCKSFYSKTGFSCAEGVNLTSKLPSRAEKTSALEKMPILLNGSAFFHAKKKK